MLATHALFGYILLSKRVFISCLLWNTLCQGIPCLTTGIRNNRLNIFRTGAWGD